MLFSRWKVVYISIIVVVLIALILLLWFRSWAVEQVDDQGSGPQSLTPDTTGAVQTFPSSNAVNNTQPGNGSQLGQVTTGQNQEPTILGNAVILSEQPINAKESDIKYFARVFAEGFGTYSNKNNFENLEKLLDVMSPTMSRDMQSVMERGRSSLLIKELYTGATTTALGVETFNYQSDSANASVVVLTQRLYQKAGVSDRQTNEKLELELVLIDNRWLVDKAEWR